MTKKSYAKFILINTFMLVCLLHISPIFAQESYLSEQKKLFIKEIQSGIYQDNYFKAHIYADSLLQVDKSDPLGYLFKAAVFISIMTYEEDDLYTKEFNTYTDSTIQVAEENIKTADPTSIAWNYLSIGHAYAYKSIYESRFGSMGSAIKTGFSAKSAYHDGLKYDSTVYDLYGGLGMYHYWKSAKAGFLRWIHVFNDDKQKGIDELYLTIDSSEVSADAAWSSLIWIYLDAKQYDSAEVIAQKMYTKYPEGNTFLWALAKIYFNSEQYKKAIDVFKLLYDKLLVERKNYFNLVECEHYIYESYKRMGDDESAHKIAIRFMYYVNKMPMKIRNRQKDKIQDLVKNATTR